MRACMAAIEVTLLVLFLASTVIGLVGSILGIGGGIFLIPIMTLGLNIPITIAAATSLVTIIVTSSTSASKYLHDGIVNIRLGMFLEIFTVVGAIIGALLVTSLEPSLIEAVFAIMLVYAAVYMQLKTEESCEPSGIPSPPSFKSRFGGSFKDGCTGKKVEYSVKSLGKGAGASAIAGGLSGLIGVGGGIVNVPAMHVWMGVPMRAAIATSTFMIGVTAVASALVYFANGLVAPVITAVAAIGIFIGATIGSWKMKNIANRSLKLIFSAVLLVISVMMFLRAGGWL